MPELPEVETVRRGLIPLMHKKIIVKLDQKRPDLRWPFPSNFSSRVKDAKVNEIIRRSKYLIFHLSSGEALLVHLGMSGRLLAFAENPNIKQAVGQFNFEQYQFEKHDHIIMHLDTGVKIIYNDPRRFGAMDLIETEKIQTHKWLKNLGPEPFSNRFSSDYLYNCLKGKKSSIKAALMNQALIAGLGNIYVLEALWLAQISPLRICSDIQIEEVEKLIVSIRSILNLAIKDGGTSLQDFRRVGGEMGYFQQNLNVYGRNDQKCKNTFCLGTIQQVKQLGRTSYYCKSCQK